MVRKYKHVLNNCYILYRNMFEDVSVTCSSLARELNNGITSPFKCSISTALANSWRIILI